MLFNILKFSILIIFFSSCASTSLKSVIVEKSENFELKPESYNSICFVINTADFRKNFTPFGIAQSNYTLDDTTFISAIEQGFLRSHFGSKESKRIQFIYYNPNTEGWADQLKNEKFDIVYHLGEVELSLSEKWGGQGMDRQRLGIYFRSIFYLDVYENLEKMMAIKLSHESPLPSSEVNIALETNLYWAINRFSEKELKYHKFLGSYK